MSQDYRGRDDDEWRGRGTTPNAGNPRILEGFEGMNYEQFREPYNQSFKDRNSTTGEQNDSKRPDES